MANVAHRSHLQPLTPGAYVDEAGVLHLDLAEMCAHAGFEPTAANQEMLQRAARELFAGAEFEEIEEGDDPDPRGTRAGIV